MATASETKVSAMSYRSAMGSEMAIMPMKCMDQMPVPMAMAPPATQMRTWLGSAAATRAASDNAA